MNKFCQSCSMPMEKDTKGGGTQRDGSKSIEYCSLCYENGEFHEDFKNSKEMVDFVKNELKKQGMGPIKQWFYTLMIPGLKRWKER